MKKQKKKSTNVRFIEEIKDLTWLANVVTMEKIKAATNGDYTDLDKAYPNEFKEVSPSLHDHQNGHRDQPRKMQRLPKMVIRNQSSTKEVQILEARITYLSCFLSKSTNCSMPLYQVLQKLDRFQWAP